jgi:hypothetical protein
MNQGKEKKRAELPEKIFITQMQGVAWTNYSQSYDIRHLQAQDCLMSLHFGYEYA